MLPRRSVLMAFSLLAVSWSGSAFSGMRMVSSLKAPKSTSTSPEAAKSDLLQLCKRTPNGSGATAEERARIEELALLVARGNPTREPARSSLLEGRWRLLHTTIAGPSSGRLGPFVGNVYQDIRPREKRIANQLELGPLRGALTADVEVLRGDTWAIKFEQVYNKLGGLTVQQKYFPRDFPRRLWRMTYLDDKLRIMYGGVEGAPKEDPESIFILERDTGNPQGV